jgi:hypothetical protein
MENLDYYIEKYGSDKKLSNYTEVYEKVFSEIRVDISSVLEIGIGTLLPEYPSSFVGNPSHYPHYKPGGSLRAWRDYFPYANVYGVDIAKDCNFSEERIQTFIFSSLEQDQCDKHLGSLTFNVIIDDGLHTADGQLATIRNLFSKVAYNGYYIIEDLGGSADGKNLFVDYAEQLKPFLEPHEYYFRGNILVIKKSYSKKGVLDKPPGIELGGKTDLTVVTGLWDIGRPGRSFDTYLELFDKLLEIENNMFIFIPRQYEHLVWKKRSRRNTHVKVYELADVKNMFAPFWDRVQNIRSDPKWLAQAGWLKDSPQATLEYYNPIVMSKMFWLHDVTIYNPFNNSNFIWLDAGIVNTVYDKFLTEQKALDKLLPLLDPFLFLCYPYETNSEIHGFEKAVIDRFAKDKVKWVARGGLFGGTKEAIDEANRTYYSLLDQTLNAGYMGTEESVFLIMAYLEPDKYRRYMLDSNGLIVKFIQALLAGQAVLEPVVTKRTYANKPTVFKLDKYKTYVYILTFNFPDQLRTLLQSFEANPEWLTRTHKVLLDNSTDPVAREENAKIAKAFNFIVHHCFDENVGINGGRFYAAKHFDTTDGDFYFFFEDDMCLQTESAANLVCRNGHRMWIPNLFDTVHKIMIREQFDFLKLTFTEVYMDNHTQCSWYNVPQSIRTQYWPEYDKLPVSGLDNNCPRVDFKHIDAYDKLGFASGDIYYCNWPMIVSKEGNKKMFLTTTWAKPYEQTWMSYMFQETKKGDIKPGVLLASPINHNRIMFYKPEERREN